MCSSKAEVVPGADAGKPTQSGGEKAENELEDDVEADEHVASSFNTSTLSINSSVEQILHVCAEPKKPQKLLKFIDKVREDEVSAKTRQRALMLIFCNTIKNLKVVAEMLAKRKHSCAVVHSQIPQVKREKALSDFKAGRLTTLVSTDVAARGLHIKHLRYV
eukprot:1465186-Amphidinium_carterae.1